MRPITLRTATQSGVVCPLDVYLAPFQVTLQAIVTGTANYTVEYTKDDIWAVGYVAATGQWTAVTAMSGATASAEATLISPVTAIRITQNSGAGSVVLRVLQAGNGN